MQVLPLLGHNLGGLLAAEHREVHGHVHVHVVHGALRQQQLVWALVGGAQAPELVLELQLIHPQYCYQINLSKTKIFLFCYVVLLLKVSSAIALLPIEYCPNPPAVAKVKVKVTQSGPTLQPHRVYSPWDSPGQNTGVGSRSLLQGIFPTQGLNRGLLHCRWIPYQLSHKGSPAVVKTIYNSVRL